MCKPSQNDLARLYHELGRLGARTVGKKVAWSHRPKDKEELLCLAGDFSRFDPRLFEALVEYMVRSWNKIAAITMRSYLQKMAVPQTVGVLGEFTKNMLLDAEVRNFFDYLLKDIPPVPFQLYFHNLTTPGTPAMQKMVTEGVLEFRKWGFLSDMRPTVDQKGKKTTGHYDHTTRHQIIKRLINKDSPITLAQYLRALHGSLSRQQAYLDLKNHPGLTTKSHGRGAVWMKSGVDELA